MVYPVTVSSGIQFLGNQAPPHPEVHDLHRVTVRCQVGEILRAGHGVRFVPDALERAHREGYDNCAWCIGESTR